MIFRPAALALAFALSGQALAATETEVATPRFKSVELMGGGKLVLRHGSTQRVTLLKGSTEHTKFNVTGSGEKGKLMISACDGRCPPSYELEIAIETQDIAGLAVRGGGAITVEGGFPQQASVAVAVQGGGTIDARALSVGNAAASVTGGGNLRIKPEHTLAASVRGGGAILYSGNPTVTRSVRGGGTIQPDR